MTGVFGPRRARRLGRRARATMRWIRRLRMILMKGMGRENRRSIFAAKRNDGAMTARSGILPERSWPRQWPFICARWYDFMSQTARVETVAVGNQGRQCAWILAGFWLIVAGIIHLLLLRTHSSLERNVYGVIAAVLGVVGLFAYFRDSVLGPRGSTWALLLAISGGLMVCVVAYDAMFLRYIHKSHYEMGNFRKAYQTKHAPLYGIAEPPLTPHLVWPILA